MKYKHYMGNLKYSTLAILGLFLLQVPEIANAAVLVSIVPDECTKGAPCGWIGLIKMGQNILHDAVVFVGMAAVVSITYAGYLYITSQGNDKKISDAHAIFEKVVWGIFFTLGAWLLVYSITDWLGVNSDFKALQK